MKRRGLLIILSSPSGAGEIHLGPSPDGLGSDAGVFRVGHDAHPREGEVDGKDYRFMDETGFKKLVADGQMLEHAHVFGHFYGSPEAPVRDAIENGCDVLFDIDWQGPSRSRIPASATMCCRSSSCRPRLPS